MTLLALLAFPAAATEAGDEARAQHLFGQLRCVVCAGESIAASDAGASRDIRALVRRRIAEGESDRQIEAYLAARYGETILADPPVAGRTLPLWLLPATLLTLGGFVVWRRVGRA